MRNNFIAAAFTIFSFQKHGLITYHLVKAAASKERAKIPIVDNGPCVLLLNLHTLKLCPVQKKKKEKKTISR